MVRAGFELTLQMFECDTNICALDCTATGTGIDAVILIICNGVRYYVPTKSTTKYTNHRHGLEVREK